MNVIVYISGKVRGLKDYKRVFAEKERELKKAGYVVLNPAKLPEGLNPQSYMSICIPMIDASDIVYVLNNYKTSSGAKAEIEYAKVQRKIIRFQGSEEK